MDVLSKKDHVMSLLSFYPHLRDDDNKLIANIWHSEIKNNITAFEFLKGFSEGKYSNPESVRRIRQKLQEEFPKLRGKKWKQRHSEQENVKDQLYNTPELYKGGTP